MYALEPHNTTENFGCVALGATISENYRPSIFRAETSILLLLPVVATFCWSWRYRENHGKYFLLT